jgi:ABC-type transport system involved in Fe-S cluster assembly fused permease/ATPase subunit
MTTMAIETESMARAPDAAPVVELRRVCKTYFKPDGSVMVEALRPIDLTIQRGEYVAVMGTSGSGKSTLMNLLGCLDRPTSGEYFLDGRDVAHMDDEELSTYRGRKIGFIFQAFNLISELTVLGSCTRACKNPCAKRGRPTSSPKSVWATASTIAPANSPAASSNASPSPAPSASNPSSSWPTNPPETSTPPPAKPSCASSKNSTPRE